MAEETPTTERPKLPNDYGVPKTNEGVISWNQADEWLAQTKIYWIATTRPDGRPHAIPIWGAWVESRFYFDGSPETRWARNLANNPAISVHIEKGDIAVMIEGLVEEVTPEGETHRKIRESYSSRYSYTPAEGGMMYMVKPGLGFAWAEFPTSVTRYKFGEE